MRVVNAGAASSSPLTTRSSYVPSDRCPQSTVSVPALVPSAMAAESVSSVLPRIARCDERRTERVSIRLGDIG
jgi:hypothetical protein